MQIWVGGGGVEGECATETNGLSPFLDMKYTRTTGDAI